MEPNNTQMPKISLNDKQLADIKDWEVGKEYEICLKVKMIAKRQGNEYPMPDEKNTDKTINATFDVTEVEVDTPDNACDCGCCDGTKGCGCGANCNCQNCGSDMQTYEADYAKNMNTNKS